MRRATGEEVKKIQLELLDVVADFCEKNGINYWIDAGSLIGAIRHKGYIPWDDDIDIGMLRPDYERFVELFSNRDDRYYLFCPEKSKDVYCPHGKVCDTTTTLYEPDITGFKSCVNIDVFIYDNVPDEATARKMYKIRERNRLFHGVKFAKNRPSGNGLRRMLVYALRYALKLFPKDFFVQRMVKNAQKHRNQETKYIGSFTTYSHMICEKDVFDGFTTAEFEGKHYQVPAGYDKFLTACYGDYMQLPPVEKRVSHHHYEAYIND